jgi:hypothetical protein
MKEISGLILFLTALILASIVLPCGFLVGVIIHCFKGGLEDYYRRCAISIDRTGNSFCGELFNKTLAKPDGYKFGNTKETISSAIGKNLTVNMLTWVGRRINDVLNMIQANHSINSIDNNV